MLRCVVPMPQTASCVAASSPDVVDPMHGSFVNGASHRERSRFSTNPPLRALRRRHSAISAGTPSFPARAGGVVSAHAASRNDRTDATTRSTSSSARSAYSGSVSSSPYRRSVTGRDVAAGIGKRGMEVAGNEVHPCLDAVAREVFEQAVAPTVDHAHRTEERERRVDVSGYRLDSVDICKTTEYRRRSARLRARVASKRSSCTSPIAALTSGRCERSPVADAS